MAISRMVGGGSGSSEPSAVGCTASAEKPMTEAATPNEAAVKVEIAAMS